MNKLSSELQRLFLVRPPAQSGGDAPPEALLGSGDTVRAMVMELAGPPDWELLSQVWRGVQAELDLPAPAIAVSGTDALQLWFSLAVPVAAAQAHGFLEALRLRFLPDVDARRLRLLPAADASAQRRQGHARLVPALQQQTGNWSAFVAPDLAPVFAETPWLDVAPGEEGQASLLRGIGVMPRAAFEAALLALGPPAPPLQPESPPTAPEDAVADPERFLRRVMSDETVALALRIEAAKALLLHSRGRAG